MEGRLEGGDDIYSGRTENEDEEGCRVVMGNSMNKGSEARKLQAIFGEWQVAAGLCCFAGSGVRMRVTVGDMRRLGGARILNLGSPLSSRHRCPPVSLT